MIKIEDIKINKNDWYFISPFGLGDTLFLCGFAQSFKKKHKGKIHLLIKKSHEDVVKMFPSIDSYTIIDFNSINLESFKKVKIKKGIISVAHPIYCKDGDILLNSFNNNEINFIQLYHKLLNIPERFELDRPVLDENYEKRAENKFKSYALKRHKTVLLCPEANSIEIKLDMVFWNKLAKKLKKEGFSICWNVTKNKKEIKFGDVVDLQIAEVIPFVNLCGNVISYRSGLCDIMAFSDANLSIIYNFKSEYLNYNLHTLFKNQKEEAIIVEKNKRHNVLKVILRGIIKNKKFFFTNCGFLKNKRKDLKIFENVFNTKYAKNVLISYITYPFSIGINNSHSNLIECYTAAEIFRDLDYNVDVVDYDKKLDIDYKKYEVIYGFGESFEKGIEKNPFIKSIMYGTGCSVSYSNIEGMKKLENFRKKTGVLALSSVRLTAFNPLQNYFSDTIIALGNEFSRSTYSKVSKYPKIYSQNCFYFDLCNVDANTKDFSEARNNFVWFGSSGALHKGLDICLDYFREHKEYNLHICGFYSDREKEFNEYYKDELSGKYKNIINHGFLDIGGEEFKKLMENSCFAISPSVSEGGSAALLNVMANGGLIPITTQACSLDIEDIAFIISDANIKNLDREIKKIEKLSDKQLQNISEQMQKEIKEKYSLNIYKANLKSNIKRGLHE